tara:strand:- start:4981 stop:8721 length:3741 start_codon:yes stop_codon:yes gene_type:complete
MPVSFNSPPRNFFLLGNSGNQAVTNFFHQEVKPIGSNTANGLYEPSEIRYNVSDQKFILASTAASESTSKRRVGFIEKRGYDAETDPENPTTTVGFGNTKPDGIKFQSGGEDGTFEKTDTYLTAMEFGSNASIIACGYLKQQASSATSTDWNPLGRGFIPWVGKFTSSGEKEWMVTSNTGDLQYTGITTDSNNNIYLCGNSVTPLNDPASATKKAQGWIEKVDVDGSYVWGQNTRFLGRDVVISKIDSNDSNQVVAVGYIDDNNGKRGYIIKLDTGTGDVVWDKTLTYHHFKSSSLTGNIGQQDHVICTDIFIDSKEQMYVVGYHGGGPNRQFIIKYTKEGNLIWQKESDNLVLVMDGTSYIPSDVWSDGETEQTIVLSEVASNQPASTILLTKFSKNGDEVWSRTLTKGSSGMQGTPHQSLDADESFYYLLFNDEAEDLNNMKSESYVFGKVSASGNGLGAFQYDDGSGAPLFDYEVEQFITHRNGRLKEGSVTNNTGDLMGYPFGANKILFDDYATNITNKKRQVDDPNVFAYGDSTASPRSPEKESSNAIVFSSSRGVVGSEWKEEDYYIKSDSNSKFGTATGASWNSHGYWDFAGSNSEYIDIENIIGDFSQLTIEVWFYCDVIDDYHNIIDCNFGTPNGGSVSSGNIGPRLEVTNAKNLTWIWGSLVSQNDPFNYHQTSFSFTNNTGNLKTGRWYCSAFSVDGDAAANGTGYLDGVKSNQTRGTNIAGTTGWLGTIDHKIRVGGGFALGGTERYHDGRIGDIRIWPRVLSRAEIWQSYNANRSRFISRPYKKPFLITENILFNEQVERNYDFNNQACLDWSENWCYFSTSIEKTLADDPQGNSHIVTDDVAIAPDGTKTAHGWIGSGTNTRHTIRFKDTGNPSAGSYNNFPDATWSCFSAYVKANGWDYVELETASYGGWNSPGGATFDIVNGSINTNFTGTGGQGIQPIGNGWYRVWAYCEVATSAATGWYINLSNSTGGSTVQVNADQGIYLWGYQNETGKKPTQWNKTMGMIVDRGSPEYGAVRVNDLSMQEPQEREKAVDETRRSGVLVNCTLRNNFYLGDTLNSPNYINFATEDAHLKFDGWTTDTTNGQTDAMWIRLNGYQPDTAWNYLLYSSFGGAVHEWGVFGNNNSIFRFKENSSQTTVTYDIGTGTWRHVAYRILPAGTITMWVDGVNVDDDGSNTIPNSNVVYNQLMGDSGATSGNGLVADLGEYTQWGQALSDTEIVKLYTETRHKYGV